MPRKRIISKGKRNMIADLIKEYDIKSVKDLHEAFKDLFGNTIQDMLEAEFDLHMGYDKYVQSIVKKTTGMVMVGKLLNHLMANFILISLETEITNLNLKLFLNEKEIFLR